MAQDRLHSLQRKLRARSADQPEASGVDSRRPGTPEWRKTDHEGALRMHPDDARGLGLAEGDRVRVRSRGGAVQAAIAQDDAMRPGVVSLPHGYGLHDPGEDQEPGARGPLINELTSAQHCDALTKTPFHKTVPARLEV